MRSVDSAFTDASLPSGAVARIRRRLGGEDGLLVTLALLVGVGSGLGAVAFRYLIQGWTLVFVGHVDPSALGHFTNPHLPFLGPFVVLLVPVLGGLLYGPLVYRFAPEARGHGVPEVMLAAGLVGMAAVFAAAGRAPITAVLIVFELTGDYSIILPLMLAVVVATGLSKVVSDDTIYTLKLRRRGIDIDRPPRPGPPTSPGEWSTASGAANGELRIASTP